MGQDGTASLASCRLPDGSASDRPLAALPPSGLGSRCNSMSPDLANPSSALSFRCIVADRRRNRGIKQQKCATSVR